jgi:hypothetical protein
MSGHFVKQRVRWLALCAAASVAALAALASAIARDQLSSADTGPKRRNASREAAAMATPAHRRDPASVEQQSIAASASGAAGTPSAPASSPRQHVLDAEARHELIAERWRGEAVDSEWTAAARASLGDLVRTAGIDLGVIAALDCHSTLCRVELEFPDHDSAMKLAAVTRQLENVYVVDRPNASEPAAEPRYTVYAVRPGRKIAELFAELAL